MRFLESNKTLTRGLSDGGSRAEFMLYIMVRVMCLTHPKVAAANKQTVRKKRERERFIICRVSLILWKAATENAAIRKTRLPRCDRYLFPYFPRFRLPGERCGESYRELWESKITSMTIHGTARRGVSALMERSAWRSLLNSFTVRF